MIILDPDNKVPFYDGATGPRRFTLKDTAGVVRDLATVAVEVKVRDASAPFSSARATLATYPGVAVSTKAAGKVDVFIRGLPTDWDGAGRDLILVPKFYFAVKDDATPATNVLLNESFDTGTTVATSWTQGGTLGPTVYEVRQDDPAPPAIFGKTQRAYVPSSGSTSFLIQTPAVSLVAGDTLSCGVWHRAHLDAGASLAGPGYYLRVQTVADAAHQGTTNLPSGAEGDWSFVRASNVLPDSQASGSIILATYDGIGYDSRFDDAYLFKGLWSVVYGEPMVLRVRRRLRPSKTDFTGVSNFIQAIGGFDEDSNADGVADGWSPIGSGGTFSVDKDPDNLNTASGDPTGTGAQKVVLAGLSGKRLRLVYRGRFKAGETWSAKIWYKNAGALTGSPAAGAFGLVLHTEEFDGAVETSTTAGANFLTTSQAAFVSRTKAIGPLAADHSVLVFDVTLDTVTGTVWFDDASLWRSA